MNFMLGDFAIEGAYRVRVRDQGGKIRAEGEHKNIVTDQLLDAIGVYPNRTTGNFFSLFEVGTGTTEPQGTDTALVSRVATILSGAPTESANYERGYYEAVFTAQFEQGAAKGNISEIGMRSSYDTGSLLVSRALILNGDGIPTSITVLDTDLLEVEYTVRLHYPKKDFIFEGVVTVDDVPTPVTITARPIGCNNYDGQFRWGINSAKTTTFLSMNQTRYRAGDLLPPGPSPTGNWTAVQGSSAQAYVSQSYEQWCTGRAGINQANGTWDHVLQLGLPLGPWQFHFSQPFQKTNVQSLEFSAGVSWSRYNPPEDD